MTFELTFTFPNFNLVTVVWQISYKDITEEQCSKKQVHDRIHCWYQVKVIKPFEQIMFTWSVNVSVPHSKHGRILSTWTLIAQLTSRSELSQFSLQ